MHPLLTEERYHKAYTYAAYRALMEGLLLEGKTTGPKQSPEMTDYTKLNDARMHRIETTTQLNADLIDAATASRPLRWWVIGEAWCGDVAQNLPTIEMIAASSHGSIELRIVLRDENLDIMNEFLTNGSLSIPKLICQDPHSGDVLGTWGPRPQHVQEMVMSFKANPTKTFKEYAADVHAWYAENKTHDLQIELLELLKAWQTLAA
jgi:hypothetical protein